MSAQYVMLVMVALAVTLRFTQELRADSAAAKLKAMIKVTATVIRDGQASELPLGELVPGDVVKLAAGDMIPADVRLISCKDLFLIQSVLTGESMPSEKFSALQNGDASSPVDLTNLCFLGTTVESGTATALVVATGARTYMGSMASAIVTQQVQTSFDKGVSRFTWLMIRFMLVMVPLVFLINGLTKHDLEGRLLLRPGRGRGADARNAAHDRDGLPLQGRHRDVPEEGDRQAPALHPELRRDGRALHGQDRHAHDGPRHPRETLRRVSQGE